MKKATKRVRYGTCNVAFCYSTIQKYTPVQEHEPS